MSVHQSSPPVQFVDYCSACLVKDWCKKIAPSGFLDVIFNCWRDCGLATCQAPSTLIEPLTRNYVVHISVAIVLLGAVSHSSPSKLVLQMHASLWCTSQTSLLTFQAHSEWINAPVEWQFLFHESINKLIKPWFKIRLSKISLKETLTLMLGVTLVMTVTQV